MRQRPLITTRARSLRQNMTSPEVMLWSRLRGRSDDRPRFRRQHPIGAVIVDFYCPAARLAVEVDGRTHEDDRRSQQDLQRDEWLDRQGITVLRVSAAAVYRNADGVAGAILDQAEEMRRCARGA